MNANENRIHEAVKWLCSDEAQGLPVAEAQRLLREKFGETIVEDTQRFCRLLSHNWIRSFGVEP